MDAFSHCNTLQHTATHCNTLQHTATHCNALQNRCASVAIYACILTLQYNATQCNTLPHTATHCDTPNIVHASISSSYTSRRNHACFARVLHLHPTHILTELYIMHPAHVHIRVMNIYSTHTHTHVPYTYACRCSLTYMTYTHICFPFFYDSCVYMRAYTHESYIWPLHTYVQSDVCYDLIIHMLMELYICTLHTYTHIHTYTHTYTHIHTRVTKMYPTHIHKFQKYTLHSYTHLHVPYTHPHISARLRHVSFSVMRVCGACVWHDYMCDMTNSWVWHDSFVRATWLICTCDMTHLYMQRDSFVCATWLICVCDVTHLCVRRDSFVCATWLTCTCNVTYLYVRHDLHTGHELNMMCVGYICVTRVCMCVGYICKIHQHVYDCIITYVWLDTGHELSMIASTPAPYLRQDDSQVSHAS